ncbi:MAG: ABC transporter permease [Pseudomonadota bacterium]
MSWLRRIIAGFIYAGVLLAAWHLIVRAFAVPAYIVPTPSAVGARLLRQPDLLAYHAGITALEIVLALIIGSAIGFAVGVLCWMSARVEQGLMPVLIVTQALPVFAIAPLLVTWLGYGLAPKLTMATLIVFFPVALATLNGLKRVPSVYAELAATMRATPLNRFLFVMLPASLGTIAVGLRLAAVSAPIGAIVGEWVGSAEGLGFLMLRANQRVEIDLVFAALAVLCTLTLLIYGLVHIATGRLLSWSPSNER